MSNEDSTLSQEGVFSEATRNSAAVDDETKDAPVEPTKNNYVDSSNDGGKSPQTAHLQKSSTHSLQIQHPPRIHLIIANIQKIANVRSMLKAAVAFGCHSVLIVGQDNNKKRHNFFPPQFQQATKTKQITLRQFDKWKECIEYLKRPCTELHHKQSEPQQQQQKQQQSNNSSRMYIVGVEIDERSRLFDDGYFEKYFPVGETDIALLMGNEGQGIIPQYLKGQFTTLLYFVLFRLSFSGSHPPIAAYQDLRNLFVPSSSFLSLRNRMSSNYSDTTIRIRDGKPECECSL